MENINLELEFKKLIKESCRAYWDLLILEYELNEILKENE